MSKLSNMLNTMCHYGVEYKKFGDIAQITRGASPRPIKNFLTKDENGVNWIKIGDVAPGSKYITQSNEKITLEGAKKSRMVHKGDFILSNSMSFGRPYIMKIDGCIHDGWLSISEFDEYMISDFLYYVLVSSDIQNEMKKRASFGGAVQNLNADIVRELVLPVPPLEVQREIVQVLDKFMLLSTELSAELLARKKQYGYYRNKILCSVEAEEMELGQVCDFIRGPFGGSLKKECFKNEGYAVYEQQHAIYGNLDIRYFVDENKFNELKRFEVKGGDLIVSCSGTIGQVYIIPENAPKGIINQALLKLTPLEMVDKRYIKYFFENKITAELNNSARGGAIKNVPSVAELKKIKIMVPPLEKQKEIVAQLDRFSNICFSTKDGIPAELEARQNQYEYYRDKLLAFKEVG